MKLMLTAFIFQFFPIFHLLKCAIIGKEAPVPSMSVPIQEPAWAAFF